MTHPFNRKSDGPELTVDEELELEEFRRKYGAKDAYTLWKRKKELLEREDRTMYQRRRDDKLGK